MHGVRQHTPAGPARTRIVPRGAGRAVEALLLRPVRRSGSARIRLRVRVVRRRRRWAHPRMHARMHPGLHRPAGMVVVTTMMSRRAVRAGSVRGARVRGAPVRHGTGLVSGLRHGPRRRTGRQRRTVPRTGSRHGLLVAPVQSADDASDCEGEHDGVHAVEHTTVWRHGYDSYTPRTLSGRRLHVRLVLTCRADVSLRCTSW